MAVPVKIASCIGVLEYWSIGVLAKEKALISTLIGPFITPLLRHSITPAVALASEYQPIVYMNVTLPVRTSYMAPTSPI